MQSAFESSVISNPSQTIALYEERHRQFESSVISNPSQTCSYTERTDNQFESSVISNPSQTKFLKNFSEEQFESSVISNPSQATMTTPDRLTKNEIANAHRRGVFLLHNIICQLRRCGVFFYLFQYDGAKGMTGERRDSLRAASYFPFGCKAKEVALIFTSRFTFGVITTYGLVDWGSFFTLC